MEIMKNFPVGAVMMWASTANIPEGWSICNGQNGTPNLSNRYPLGTTNSALIGQLYGAENHSHAVSGNTSDPSGGNPNGSPLAFETQGDHKFIHHHSISGGTDTAANYPPSTYVIFIMKTKVFNEE